MRIVANPLFSPGEIRSHFLLTGNAAETIANRSTGVDELVAHAYRTWLAGAFEEGMAVLAVGGYGRRELFPFSDIDLLLLVDREIQGDAKREALSGFLRSLWDNGLRLSQSVRNVAECCQLDPSNVELSVSLIDQRFLIGDHKLYELLAEKLPKFFRTQRQPLSQHLCRLTQTRHAKFNDTIYHLEPNVKETPGGLRDLHLVHWLSQLRGTEDASLTELQEARGFLSVLRCKLHYTAGRDNNLLTFDLQEQIAENPAEWMREYYRHARDIHRTALRQMEVAESQAETGLAKQFRDWRSRLSNADFTVSRERVFLRSPQQLATDPEIALRLFEFVGRHGVRLSVETERRLKDHTLYFEEYFASRRPVWSALRNVLYQPHAALAIRAMHETRLLELVFPAWEQIECLVVRDFYHRYTVDEHTLLTLGYLEELRSTSDPSRRRFALLLEETEQLPLLLMALLFHDTGKHGGLAGHSAESARLAAPLLEQIQMPEADRRNVLFLIEHHLDLSAVMNSRDLSDPATAMDLAGRVQTIEYLRQLTLLTYADISAVNPEAMTPWRLEQLWRTYLVAHRELTRDLETERIHLAPSDEKASFLEGFPTRYLRTHTEEEVRSHMQLEELSRVSGVAIDLKRENGVYILTSVTTDRPYLFANLVGVLASFGMNILKAEAFSNARGVALDTFCFADPLRTLDLNPAEVERLKALTQRAVLGKEDVRRLLRGRAKMQSLPRPEPTVAFDAEASDAATLVEIVAQDRPGLLYDLAETFSGAGCSIDVVLIDTEANKALDVFYVTKGGEKLDEASRSELRKELLTICRAA